MPREMIAIQVLLEMPITRAGKTSDSSSSGSKHLFQVAQMLFNNSLVWI